MDFHEVLFYEKGDMYYRCYFDNKEKALSYIKTMRKMYRSNYTKMMVAIIKREINTPPAPFEKSSRGVVIYKDYFIRNKDYMIYRKYKRNKVLYDMNENINEIEKCVENTERKIRAEKQGWNGEELEYLRNIKM